MLFRRYLAHTPPCCICGRKFFSGGPQGGFPSPFPESSSGTMVSPTRAEDARLWTSRYRKTRRPVARCWSKLTIAIVMLVVGHNNGIWGRVTGALVDGKEEPGGGGDVLSGPCAGMVSTSEGRSLVERYMGFLRRFERRLDENACTRIQTFAENERRAGVLNRQELGSAEYSASYSPFGDMSEGEFAREVLMQNKMAALPTKMLVPTSEEPFKDYPQGFDWVARGAVSRVRNQGSIGSCYAFASAGAIEGQLAIQKNQRNVTVSVEQVLECSSTKIEGREVANCGEFGGWPSAVFEFWRKVGFVRDLDFPCTIDQKTSLPLCFPCMARGYSRSLCGNHDDLYCNASTTLGQSRSRHQCHSAWAKRHSLGRVLKYESLGTNETCVGHQLVDRGPLATVMDASTLQLYRRGVASPWFCSEHWTNHAVLLVGYGDSYWKVKNSWGSKWGEDGFFRIKRGKCGVGLHAVAVELASDIGFQELFESGS